MNLLLQLIKCGRRWQRSEGLGHVPSIEIRAHANSSQHLKLYGVIIMSTAFPPGTAPIKAQSVLRFLFRTSEHSPTFFLPTRYVVSLQNQTLPDDDAAEGNTSHVSLGRPTEADSDDHSNALTQGEKPRLSGAQRKKLAREEKKKRRGQNKGRRFQKMRDELDLCWKVAVGDACEFGSECAQPLFEFSPNWLKGIQVPVHTQHQGVPFRQTQGR